MPEETTTGRSFKLTRSLTDLTELNPLILTSQDSIFTSTKLRSNNSRNESFEETINNLKHSASESDLKANDDNNDDDDVWCNQEDEDNLKHCVELDQERIEQLREILGQETLQTVLDVCQVRKQNIL